MSPIIIKHPLEVDYLHSYAQDSPFFAGLAQKKLLGRNARPATMSMPPRGWPLHALRRGDRVARTAPEGRVHTFTTCYYSGQAFLGETPFHLVLVEFDGADTLFLSRLVGTEPQEASRSACRWGRSFVRNSKFKPTDVYFVPAE